MKSAHIITAFLWESILKSYKSTLKSYKNEKKRHEDAFDMF